MSSTSFYILTAEFPEERAAILKLEELIEQGDGRKREFTANRLLEIAGISSARVFAKIIGRLVEDGLLQKKVRVESTARGGIGDFDSLLDVPSVIYDSQIGKEIEVNLDQVHLIYKIPAHENVR